MDPVSRGREVSRGILRSSPKPEKRPNFFHRRGIEKFCHLFSTQQRPNVFVSDALLDVLTPLSDCRQESVEKMERRISGVSYMCWMDFHNGILCCWFLCARLIHSLLSLLPRLSLFRLPRRGLPRPIYTSRAITPRAITPLPPLHGYHACVYISRLSRHFRSLPFTGYHATCFFSIYTTTGAPHVPTYSTR